VEQQVRHFLSQMDSLSIFGILLEVFGPHLDTSTLEPFIFPCPWGFGWAWGNYVPFFCKDNPDDLGSSELAAMLVGKEPGFTRFRVMTVCCTRYFDIRKAKSVLGYEPIVDLNEGMARAGKVRPVQSLDFSTRSHGRSRLIPTPGFTGQRHRRENEGISRAFDHRTFSGSNKNQVSSFISLITHRSGVEKSL